MMVYRKKSKIELSLIAKKAVETRRKNRLSKIAKKAVRSRRTKTKGHTIQTQKLKKEVMLVYSKRISKKDKPTCACCGLDLHLDFLAIDHIHGRKQGDRKTGKQLYAYLKKENYPKGYQVLCWNCNTTKELYGKCPHKR